ncbi:hypothetical protein MSG28_015178 [Choristoneura fumiferana]|uniref:Uncharacterized protein n=1 Tax=Choristoneura fumiferana TaxID=7141 RepID=A0ACC0KYS2_CHOFU|nr:hypothetical protein MSG28_015178 [Choristoneura fumiferana]
MSKVNIPTFKLNSGYQIPVLGYGTFLGFNDKNEFDYSDWDKMLKTLSYCIDVGYRHIDTAHLYRVEPDIGEVVNRKIKEGVVTREEMFITTKVEGVDEKIDYLETWRGFESVLSKGLVRSIGVSNFNVEQLKRLVANCKVKPAVNQVELNLAHGQKELVEYCKTQNIKVTAWAPFGAMIASRALPDAPAPRVDDPTLVAIAKKYGKTVMQTLSYCIDVGYRHIDTAHLYRVEPDIGEVVNRKIKEGVSVRGSLRRLGLEYLDMVLVHWPMSISEEGVDEKIDYLETWRGFESVLSKGLVRSIGVSNFNVEQLKRLVANCKVKPAVNQVELNLAFGQKELVDYCNTQNIKITAWAPFGAMITSRAPPDAPGPRVDDLTLVAIAKKYGKTVMQVTLRYLLTTSEFSTIAKFDVNYRSNRPTFWQNYTNYPFEKYDVPESPIPESLRKWKNGKNNDME